ncbi:MAG: alpha-glucan family phosphorylase, partial [Thermodesulfobacteriota bacterium]
SRLSGFCNGVSRLHGRVARGMWSGLWPKRPEDEIPITHVTNGIHLPTWISQELNQLLERYLGPDWMDKTNNLKQIERIQDISAEELWRIHEMARTRLIAFCRRCLFLQYSRRHAAADVLHETGTVLRQGVLTIGFARRFASYKRSGLLLQDPERFKALLTSPERPVQIIFAGKAHPMDNEGKELIQKIVEFSRKPSLRRKIIFLENYDMDLGRHLYQGVDIWLNTPRRPLEACGTSGMKAAVNGALNVSILDGWWDEAYTPSIGWAIGQRNKDKSNPAYQDNYDAQSLYSLLENEVIPCFYDREETDLPEKWINMMRESMRTAMTRFSSLRMLKEYNERFYEPLAARTHFLLADDAAEARRLAGQRERLYACWPEISIKSPVFVNEQSCRVGDRLEFSATVSLGRLRPEEVTVQLYYGPLTGVDTVSSSNIQEMEIRERLGENLYQYGCSLPCDAAGHYGFTVRVIPAGDDWMKNLPDLITWS